ncbi:hypothetical protein [Poritiphilus flavus]|uniref:DUF4136 domain-containing protein n=1 Tax=Poritiphilus flavus TaxID=2697053 RepID=A0A6L9E9V6_9FLAO|nr:hypothetical protein [Poritiphilus flavus]NAS11486.1 hypothetical protein [Poritiphilus flavus]
MNTLKHYLFLSLISVFFLLGCGPAKMSSTWTKDGYKDRAYGKVAVVGMSKDLESRNLFEGGAVALLKENGINAVEGISMFPPGSGKNLKAKDYIRIIKENELDGVITMALIDSKESERYQPGETVYVPSYYRVGRYIARGYNVYSTPGYYQPTKTYLIEAVLYDVKGELSEGKETMVWTGQSSLMNPSSLESASKSFTKRLVNQLIADNIVSAK